MAISQIALINPGKQIHQFVHTQLIADLTLRISINSIISNYKILKL
jgi:hypothetical protein